MQAYLEENNECEFKLFGTIDPPGGHCDLLDPHHIGRIRHDRPECLLTLCRQCHNYGHLHDPDFVVWSIWTKLKKNELDIDLLDQLKRGASFRWALDRRETFILEETIFMAAEIKKAMGYE